MYLKVFRPTKFYDLANYRGFLKKIFLILGCFLLLSIAEPVIKKNYKRIKIAIIFFLQMRDKGI